MKKKRYAQKDKKQDGENKYSSFQLTKYKLIRQIGHGAQGEIFLAKRLADGKKVAIKRLNIGSINNWKKYDLFYREAEVLKKLNIDGVAKFYEAFDRLEDTPP